MTDTTAVPGTGADTVALKTATDPQSDAGVRSRLRSLEVDVEAILDRMRASATKPEGIRAAAAEALLAGGLLLADVSRTMATWSADAPAKASEERFRKAMEMLREALS